MPKIDKTASGSYLINTGLGLYPSVYQVKMFVLASTAGVNIVSATLDPFFYIDPSFAYADDVSLLFSTGINNIPASSETPLPSSWFLLLSGLAALAYLCHRRAWGLAVSRVFLTFGFGCERHAGWLGLFAYGGTKKSSGALAVT